MKRGGKNEINRGKLTKVRKHRFPSTTRHVRIFNLQVPPSKCGGMDRNASIELKQVFKYLDQDSSGFINVCELVQLAKLLVEIQDSKFLQNLMPEIESFTNCKMNFQAFETWHHRCSSIDRSHAYAQLLNVRFARDNKITFPVSRRGLDSVPGFYLLEDYQQLLRGK